MCSEIFFRITLICSTRSPTPGFGIEAVGTSDVVAGAVARGGSAAGVVVDRDGPDSIKLRMSFLVTRPLIPVPSSFEMSTPCSSAILRTRGLDLVRRRSSTLSSAEVFCGHVGFVSATGEGAGVVDGAGGLTSAGLLSLGGADGDGGAGG